MNVKLENRDKADYVAAYAKKTGNAIPAPNWTQRQKIALVCRILASHGHASGLAGQVTIRGEKPGSFWIHDYRYGLEEVCARDVMLINYDMDVMEGTGMANPGARFHSWIYTHRPDVNAICHTHPIHASALSMLEVPLVASHMDTVGLYEEVGFLKEWPGIPFGDDEGRIIADALGDKRCVFLSHHGPLAACASIEEACVLLVAMERAARLQLLAQSAGKIQPINTEHGVQGKRLKQTPGSYMSWFAHYARTAARSHAECLL
jgi:L-fuculose-phosphate aldolase